MRWPRRWWEMVKDGYRAFDRWVKENDVDIDM